MHIGVRGKSVMFFNLFFYIIYYRQDGTELLRAGFVFTQGPIFRFFAPQGLHVALIKVKSAKFQLDRIKGVGLQPKTLKIGHFTNIIAPKGRVLCTILTKFTGFMRILNLHNSGKFHCFSSINDKTINNLPQWGHSQPNIR